MQRLLNNIIVFLILFILWYSVHGKSENKFPEQLKFGVATASFQVEGGWNASGKGENIWDRLMHKHPEYVVDHSNGDVTCDSYHLWRTDIEMLKDIGVHFYRFSLSWTRILPTGFSNRINSDGVKYYNNIINSLLENGIEPLVTLYHWDLPQKLQELGGWTSVQTAEYFADFARIAFRLFGDRVKRWITINEPSSICLDSYDQQIAAPFIDLPGIGCYLCGKTVLIAHSKAYHIYDREFRKKQKGKIGITIDSQWVEPKTNKTEDIEAAERYMQMVLGWWAHPIFSKEGDYPEIMRKRIDERSALENFAESRLPHFTQTEIDNLKGSADFFGLNHYHTGLCSHVEFPISDSPAYFKDLGVKVVPDPNWKPNQNIVPWGFYKLLRWVAKEYNNPLVYVTENGYGDSGQEGLLDTDRIVFLKGFLKALLQAVQEGCNVQKYTVWSLMDNLEWTQGYTVKFGLYKVDFNSPNRTRTPRASARLYKYVIKTGTIPNKTDFFLNN